MLEVLQMLSQMGPIWTQIPRIKVLGTRHPPFAYAMGGADPLCGGGDPLCGGCGPPLWGYRNHHGGDPMEVSWGCCMHVQNT